MSAITFGIATLLIQAVAGRVLNETNNLIISGGSFVIFMIMSVVGE